MESGDGLISPRAAPVQQAVARAARNARMRAAQRFGDGNLYLSNRANVHIRGVTAAGTPRLWMCWQRPA